MKGSSAAKCLEEAQSVLSRLNKPTRFHTYLLSNFNYCPLAWHFCNENNSRKLEKIQKRACCVLCTMILILLMKNV